MSELIEMFFSLIAFIILIVLLIAYLGYRGAKGVIKNRYDDYQKKLTRSYNKQKEREGKQWKNIS